MKKKKGLALLFVMIMLSFLIIICAGLFEISMISLRQSDSYYNKNSAFYYADNALEKLLYYIDLAADNARTKANEACFLPNGLPNLDNPDIKDKFNQYLNDMDLDKYKDEVKKVFIKEYKDRIRGFFNNESPLYIKLSDSQSAVPFVWSSKNGGIKEKVESEISNDDAIITIDKYDEADMSFKSGGNAADFEYYGSDSDLSLRLPIETVYITVSLKNKNVKRYMVSTFEMNPFGYDKDVNKVKAKTAEIKRGYNKLLDYALVCGRNLIAVNGNSTFTINGDVYVRGTYNALDAQLPSKYYGGILAGMDSKNFEGLKKSDSKYERLNPTDLSEADVPFESGKINILGDAFVGYPVKNDLGEYYLGGGFVKSIGQNSNIRVLKNLYCHSVVTEEGSEGSRIQIGEQEKGTGDCYIADNISLYGKNSSISIAKSLIGFETADSENNYNSSPSIVANDSSCSLSVGKNVILFGSVFVDNLIKANDPGLRFRMAETSSINPNFIAYSYIDKDTNPFAEKYYLNGESIYMFDRDKAVQLIKDTLPVQHPEMAVPYILDYIKNSIINPIEYDYQYNFGSGIINIPNIKLSQDPEDTSYFPFILIANNGIFTSRNISSFYQKDIGGGRSEVDNEAIKNIEDTIKNAGYGFSPLGGDGINVSGFDTASLMEKLRDRYLPDIKKMILNKMLFRDKGKESANGFEDYIDWDEISGDIDIEGNANGKSYKIVISKGDINISDLNSFNNKYVLLVSKGNIILNNNSQYAINMTGNIIAEGDIVIKGNDINLTHDDNSSKELMNYLSLNDINASLNMYRFFSKGITEGSDSKVEFLAAFEKTVKTNIKVLSRREFVK